VVRLTLRRYVKAKLETLPPTTSRALGNFPATIPFLRKQTIQSSSMSPAQASDNIEKIIIIKSPITHHPDHPATRQSAAVPTAF
jgi:hypothetical protein